MCLEFPRFCMTNELAFIKSNSFMIKMMTYTGTRTHNKLSISFNFSIIMIFLSLCQAYISIMNSAHGINISKWIANSANSKEIAIKAKSNTLHFAYVYRKFVSKSKQRSLRYNIFFEFKPKCENAMPLVLQQCRKCLILCISFDFVFVSSSSPQFSNSFESIRICFGFFVRCCRQERAESITHDSLLLDRFDARCWCWRLCLGVREFQYFSWKS